MASSAWAVQDELMEEEWKQFIMLVFNKVFCLNIWNVQYNVKLMLAEFDIWRELLYILSA